MTDIYSCGIVFWEIMTCQVPFQNLQDKHLSVIYEMISVSYPYHSYSLTHRHNNRKGEGHNYQFPPTKKETFILLSLKAVGIKMLLRYVW